MNYSPDMPMWLVVLMAIAAIATALGVGAVITAVVTGLFGRKKAKADAADVLVDTARDLIKPLSDRIGELMREKKESDEEQRRLRHRIEDLETDLRWLRAERADQVRRDAAMQGHLKAMNHWVDEWLPRARNMGLEIPDPPEPPDLVPLVDPSAMTIQAVVLPRSPLSDS